MSKDSLVKYYTKNKKEKQSFQRKLVKVMKIFLTRKKTKKRQYACELYKNLPESKKQKLVEYRKKYYKARKNKND